RGGRAQLDLELAVVCAVVVVAGDARAGEAWSHPLEVVERGPHDVDRGLHLEGLLHLHRVASSSLVSMSRGFASPASSTSAIVARSSKERKPMSPWSSPTRFSSVRRRSTGCPGTPS